MVSPEWIFENNVTDTRYNGAVDETSIEMEEFLNQLRIVFSTIEIVFSVIGCRSSETNEHVSGQERMSKFGKGK